MRRALLATNVVLGGAVLILALLALSGDEATRPVRIVLAVVAVLMSVLVSTVLGRAQASEDVSGEKPR